MPEDDLAMFAERLFRSRERPAAGGLHPQRLEETGRHAEALHAFRLVAADEVDVPVRKPGEMFDRRHLTAPVEEVCRRRGLTAIVAAVWLRLDRKRDALRFGEAERAYDQRIDDRENRGVRA